jgi:ATP-dependent Lhr-like helicase
VMAEGVPGGFSGIYPELGNLETLGTARRGYFVEGLGGAQFALPGAIERLRERPGLDDPPLVLSAVDPAQPYGSILPWPRRDADSEGEQSGPVRSRGPARVSGAYVVLMVGAPILYLERGGKGLVTLVPAGDERLAPALAALAEHVRSGRGSVRRMALDKVDGEPATGSALEAELVAVGFQEGPRRLTLSA